MPPWPATPGSGRRFRGEPGRERFDGAPRRRGGPRRTAGRAAAGREGRSEGRRALSPGTGPGQPSGRRRGPGPPCPLRPAGRCPRGPGRGARGLHRAPRGLRPLRPLRPRSPAMAGLSWRLSQAQRGCLLCTPRVSPLPALRDAGEGQPEGGGGTAGLVLVRREGGGHPWLLGVRLVLHLPPLDSPGFVSPGVDTSCLSPSPFPGTTWTYRFAVGVHWVWGLWKSLLSSCSSSLSYWDCLSVESEICKHQRKCRTVCIFKSSKQDIGTLLFMTCRAGFFGEEFDLQS